jgi:copper chaperone CopZ
MSVYSPADASFKIGAAPQIAVEEILLASRDLGDGTRQTDLSVPGMHCGGCMAAVEKTLAALDGVASARVNLSTKRVAVRWDAHGGGAPDLIGALARRGYPAHLFSLEAETKETMAVMGADFWKYGVHESLPEIEALTQYAHEQGLIDRKLALEELFAAPTFEMSKV